MKLYYAYNEAGQVTNSVQEDYDKIGDWKTLNPQWVLQEEVSRDNDKLKVVDGVVVLKNEEDYRQERIANAEESKTQLLDACTRYQQGETHPRLDTNFWGVLIGAQTLIKNCEILKYYVDLISNQLETPVIVEIPSLECCTANLTWSNQLWYGKYESLKEMIDSGDEILVDFTECGNPPHTFDECYNEVINYTPST